MSEIVVSPMTGRAVSLDKVNDEMFSQRMLGDGMAIEPEEEKITSPIDGEVTMVYETQHAIGLKSDSGLEILLHIGIDTVMLNGEPFDTRVKAGDRVKKGDLLTVVDWSVIRKKGCDTIVPVLAISRKVKPLAAEGKIRQGDALFETLE